MNRERAKELLPIIQAFAEGREVQIRGLFEGKWIDAVGAAEDVGFYEGFEYRIKPKPREFWISPSYALTSKDFIPDVHDSDNFIKVIEVIE